MSAVAKARSGGEVPPQDLIEAVLADIEARVGGGPTHVMDVHLIRNPYSRVFRITVGEGRQRIFLKMPRVRPDNRQRVTLRLKNEYSILSKLHGLFDAVRGLDVVTPLGLYLDHCALATLEARGRVLRDELASASGWLASKAQKDHLREHVRRCGLWLRHFHSITAQPAAPFDGRDFVDYCAARLGMQENGVPVLSGQTASSIMSGIEAEVRNAERSSCEMAGRHNDFAGHNIFVSNEDATVLDFYMFDHGSIYYDVCSFWMDLEFMKFDPRYRSVFCSSLQADFLSAYGRVSEHDPLFKLVKRRYLLNRMLNARSRGRSRSLPGLGSRFEARVCERALLRTPSERDGLATRP